LIPEKNDGVISSCEISVKTECTFRGINLFKKKAPTFSSWIIYRVWTRFRWRSVTRSLAAIGGERGFLWVAKEMEDQVVGGEEIPLGSEDSILGEENEILNAQGQGSVCGDKRRKPTYYNNKIYTKHIPEYTCLFGS